MAGPAEKLTKQTKPGAYIWLGADRAIGRPYVALHNPRYDFNEETLILGASTGSPWRGSNSKRLNGRRLTTDTGPHSHTRAGTGIVYRCLPILRDRFSACFACAVECPVMAGSRRTLVRRTTVRLVPIQPVRCLPTSPDAYAKVLP